MRETGKQLLRFACVGGGVTALYYALLILSVEKAGLRPVPVSVIGVTAGACLTYILNYRWTFGSNSKHLPAVAKHLCSLGTASIFNAASMFISVDILELNYLLSQLAITGVIFIANYYVSVKWTFKSMPMGN